MSKNCYHCDSKLMAGKGIEIYGKNITVCEECADDVYQQCPLCGKYACAHDFIYVEDDFVCIWCVSEKFVLCPRCSDFFPAEQMVEIHGYVVCPDCLKDYFQECRWCHKSYERDEIKLIYVDHDYKEICLKCWRENYFLCADCLQTRPKQEVCNYKGQTFCKNCFKNIVSEDIFNGKLDISALSISDNKTVRFASPSAFAAAAAKSNEAYFEDGYADDYVGDGLDGRDDYLGDGLDE